jgi:pimeloyl-ACP methyl ester carboxylesterase
LLAALLSAGQTLARRSTAEMEVKKVKVNDAELAYVEEGAGDPVVFVHGFTGDWRSRDVLRPFISKQYRYVAYSRRGHYPNAWIDDGPNYTLAQRLEHLATLIRALNVGKVHLVGNSGGGRIAGYVALKYPELVRSVVMGDPGIIQSDSAAAKEARTAAQNNSAKATGSDCCSMMMSVGVFRCALSAASCRCATSTSPSSLRDGSAATESGTLIVTSTDVFQPIPVTDRGELDGVSVRSSDPI